jgi:two-component system, cell cycle sensor histidine kinase and response regulator CckA
VNDPARLDALAKSRLLDSPPEPAFDRLTRLAARILDAPTSLVSLVEEDRQFFKSCVGLSKDLESSRETPISHSFCQHVVMSEKALIVTDARIDPRVRDNLAVEEFGVVAYAGFPLISGDGHILGTLCAIDYKPRDWTPEELESLEDLAHAVQTEVRLRDALQAAETQGHRLRESEARFHQMAENLSEAIWIYSADFSRAIYVSPRASELWGIPLEEIYERPLVVLEQIDPEDRALLGEAMGADEPTELICRFTRRGDTHRGWMRITGVPIRDEDGKVYRAAGIVEEITERRKVEEALRASERHYRRLVETSPFAIFSLDLGGRVTELNSAGEGMMGGAASELIGQSFNSFFRGEQLERAQEHVQALTSGEAGTLDVELVMVRPTGRPRRIHLTSTAIREEHAIVGIQGIARDVTDEAIREEQLSRAQRLASLGTLVGGVAHELNNPLTSIRGFIQLLRDDEGSLEREEMLATIDREAQRMTGIVGDLRRLARGSQEERREGESVDLNDIIQHVVRVRRYGLETHNIKLKLDLGHRLPMVHGDPGQLEQMILNLVVNAEQALEEVDQKKRLLILRTRAARRGITVSIYDRGPGIPPSDLSRIFDPFWTTKEPNQGTGLGLSLVHRIVSEHGGEVDVQSQVGEGTLFMVQLPRITRRIAPPPERPQDVSEPEFPSATGRVLIVDDEEAIRHVIMRALMRAGHVVELAQDGSEALARVQSEPATFDVVISDLRMPGMGGAELFRRLGSVDPALQARMIFITGDASALDDPALERASGVPVLQKPFDLTELIHAVSGLLEGSERPW